MDIELLNIYQRLRDFHVPAPVLDAIFSDPESQSILVEAWRSLEGDGFSGDEAAREIAEMIYQEFPELESLIDDLKK
ncbi:MAG: hypothetical protein D6762_09920 [Candidatus Neomarinimicrobiota bacterium]|nr:MAG: hypothetical protein D6762_09920 [Candidatus Neomarinimicrobiota bacterium]